MEFLNFNSVELLPNAKASAMFSVDSGSVFKEQGDINPIIIERLSYMPWGGGRQPDALRNLESDRVR